MFPSLLRSFLFALCISLIACGGSKKEEAKPTPAKPASTSPKPASEAGEDNQNAQPEQEETNAARKDRAEAAFRAAYCATSKGDMDGANKAYKDNGFEKGRAHFLRVWKFYAKKDAAWANAIAKSVAKKPCQ